MIKTLFILLLTTGLLVMLPGCGEGSGTTAAPPVSGIPTDPPAIQGTITSMSQGSILVEESPGDTTGSSKILLRLTGNTRLLRSDGSAASGADLATGLKVRAWVTGPVATSYPEQGEAAAVVIDR